MNTDDRDGRHAIERALRNAIGEHFSLREFTLLGQNQRGPILKISGGHIKLFVKTGDRGVYEQFRAEADGLDALRTASAFRVPRIIALHCDGQHAVLALEYLELRPLRSADEGALFAEALLSLHHSSGDDFGWHRDNFIGATPQRNTPMADWARFFVECRLKPQLALARDNGFPKPLLQAGERLLPRVAALFLDYRPVPSLLHGDL